MGSRMDKYIEDADLPKRSDKNKELYKQIYNAYDEFENLIVPSNAREIQPDELKREIVSRQDYKKKRDYDVVNNNGTNNSVIRKEKILEEQKQEDDIYDINELLNKATSDKKRPELIEPTLANADYLKKLKLDSRKTNIEQVKEMYEDIQEESLEEDAALLKTANLSLEILSDLKGSDGDKVVSAPIKDDEEPENTSTMGFYSGTYKFSDRDFDGVDDDLEDEEDEEDDDDRYEKDNNNSGFFVKIAMIILGLLLVALIIIYLINYFKA